MDFTAADAIMVGRAAQSKPWIFRQIAHYLDTNHELEEPDLKTRKTWLLQHLENLYQFYGEYQGLRIARKHILWQLDKQPGFASFKPGLMSADSIENQLGQINLYFDQLVYGYIDKAS